MATHSEVYAVLDATHYPVAIFRNLQAAHIYKDRHPDGFAMYVIRTVLTE